MKLLPTRVRARIRAFFTNAGMGKSTVVPYPLGTNCHPYIFMQFCFVNKRPIYCNWILDRRSLDNRLDILHHLNVIIAFYHPCLVQFILIP